MKKVLVIMVVVFAFFFVSSCGTDSSDTKNDNDNGVDADTENSVDADTENGVDDEVADVLIEEERDELDSELDDESADEDVYVPVVTDFVLLKTNKGDIVIGLYENEVPNTTANFKQYVGDEFYDGLIFHRIVPGFVIQGGGYDKDLVARKTREEIDFEGSPLIKHLKYVVSMARSTNMDSASSQFFIMLDTAPHLDYTSDEDFFEEGKFPCTAFGVVTEGFEIVDKISALETETVGMFEDVPVEPVIIESAMLTN